MRLAYGCLTFLVLAVVLPLVAFMTWAGASPDGAGLAAVVILVGVVALPRLVRPARRRRGND